MAAVAVVAAVALLDVMFYADRGGLFALCLAAAAPASLEALGAGWSLAPSSLAAVAALSAVVLGRRLGRGGLARSADSAGRADAPILEVAAVLLLATALLSPLCRLAGVLASANMLQHMLLVAVVPALIAFGFGRRGRDAIGHESSDTSRHPLHRISRDAHHQRPGLVASQTAPGSAATGFEAVADAPPDASAAASRKTAMLLALTVLHGASIWLWHVPAVYGAALADAGVNVALHLGAFGIALLFYVRIAAATTVTGLGAVFATLVHTGLLGALLTFAPAPLYLSGLADASGFGLDPLFDQQAAGLLMWIGGGFFYAGLLFVLTRRFLGTHLPAGLALVARRADW